LETTIEVARQFQTDLLESIVVQEAQEAVQQALIKESVNEEAFKKLRSSDEIVHKHNVV